jgi:hypothetical protein
MHGSRYKDAVTPYLNTIFRATTLTMKLYDNITPDLQTWIETQKVFFVGTAPLSGDGHVNLSPKGHDSLRVLDEKTVCYLDMTGSGNETCAHILENGRITLMWCGFQGPPRILRLYGKGEIVLRNEHDARWKKLASNFDSLLPGTRQIIVNHVDRVQTSCGMAVPFMEYTKERTALQTWSKAKGEERLNEYRQEHNMKSIDGIDTPIATVHK